MSKIGTIEKEKLFKVGEENRARKSQTANSNVLEHYKKNNRRRKPVKFIRTFLNPACLKKKKPRTLTTNKSKQEKIIKIISEMKLYSQVAQEWINKTVNFLRKIKEKK